MANPATQKLTQDNHGATNLAEANIGNRQTSENTMLLNARITDFSWCTHDQMGIEVFLGTNDGYHKTVLLPEPQSKRAATLDVGHGVKLNLEWGKYADNGVEATSLKVSLGDRSFVVVENLGLNRWIHRAVESDGQPDPYFKEYWQHAT